MSKNKRFYAFQTDTTSRTSVKQFVKLLNQCSLRQANLVRDLTELLPNSDLAHRMSQCDSNKCGSSPCSFACYMGKRPEIGQWLYGIAGRQIVNGQPTIGMELRYLGQTAAAGDLHTLDVRAGKAALTATLLEAERRVGPFLASALITPRFDVWPDGRREWRLVYYIVLSAESIHEDELRLKKAIAGADFDGRMVFYYDEVALFDWKCVAPIPEGELLMARRGKGGDLKWHSEPLPRALRVEYARWLDETPGVDRLVDHGLERLLPVDVVLAGHANSGSA
jgi:hypothetical protein